MRWRRIWCWFMGNKWKRGQNGWENFGSGTFCEFCSKEKP